MTTPIIVRQAQSQDEHRQAHCLIESIYRNRNYVQHLDAPKYVAACYIAVETEQIVGSVSVMTATRESLPTEHIFDVRFDGAPFCYPREVTFEIGRLGSIGNNRFHVLRGLIAATCAYALVHGLEPGLISMKPRLSRLLREYLHIPLYGIDNQVVETRVEDAYQGYFLGGPPPQAFYVLTSDTPQYLPQLKKAMTGEVSMQL